MFKARLSRRSCQLLAAAALLVAGACAQSHEKLGGSWETRSRSTGLIESGNLITSLHRVSGLGSAQVDDYVHLARYYGDDCVVYEGARDKALFSVCGDRLPVLVVAAGSAPWETRPEGVVLDGEVFVRDGAPWRRRKIVPIEVIKKWSMAAGSYSPSWRAILDKSKEMPVGDAEKKLGADERDANGWTPLRWLVVQKDAVQVGALLKGGADPNIQDAHGDPPLISAAASGQDQIVSLLLQAGAKPDLGPSPEDTPLLSAVRGRHVSTALTLIKAGANVKARRQDGQSVLSLARELKLDSVAEALERAGATNS